MKAATDNLFNSNVLDGSICKQGLEAIVKLLMAANAKYAGLIHPAQELEYNLSLDRFVSDAKQFSENQDAEKMVDLVERIRSWKPIINPAEQKVFDDKYDLLRRRLKFAMNSMNGAKRDNDYHEKVDKAMCSILTAAHAANNYRDHAALDVAIKAYEDFKPPARTK